MEDFYDLLEVSEDASTEEIDRAWRQKVRTYHPDVNDDTRANAQFKTLKKAHEVLADETERAAYDRMGHESYVRQRLDGLPTKGLSHPTKRATDEPGRTERAAETNATAETDSTTRTDRATETDSTTRTDRATNGKAPGNERATSDANGRAGTRDRTGGRRTTTDRASTERTRTQDASGARRSGRRRSQSGRTSASGATQGQRTSTDARKKGTDGNAAAGGTTARGESSTVSRSGGRSPPLLYGWIGVLLAGVVYVAGLWQYLLTNAGALSTLRRVAATDPTGALTATHELVAPGLFVLESATVDAPLTLLFPVGTVALALALALVVHSFGRGVAYLYALGGLVPLLSLALGPVATLPDGIVLVLVGVCPLLATAGFLVDVGRVVY